MEDAQPPKTTAGLPLLEARDAKGQYVKGRSGNPTGGVQRAHQIRRLAQSYAPRAIKELFVIALTSDHEPSRVAAGKYIVDQAIGRPVQGITLSDPNGGPVRLSAEVLGQLTDQELLALRSVAAKLVEAAQAREPRAIEARAAGAAGDPGPAQPRRRDPRGASSHQPRGGLPPGRRPVRQDRVG